MNLSAALSLILLVLPLLVVGQNNVFDRRRFNGKGKGSKSGAKARKGKSGKGKGHVRRPKGNKSAKRPRPPNINIRPPVAPVFPPFMTPAPIPNRPTNTRPPTTKTGMPSRSPSVPAPIIGPPTTTVRPSTMIPGTSPPTGVPNITTNPPVGPPTLAPTFAPTIPRVCQPTSGQCLTTAQEITTALEATNANDIIGICGGSQISTTSSFVVRIDNITFCCTGPDPCTLQNTGTDRILRIFGESLTLQDLVFLDGATTNSGGNVGVTNTDGNILIQGCEMTGGSASSGGNLYIITQGNVTIQDSVFANGEATNSGAGVQIVSARNIRISNTQFQNNNAGVNGGGLFLQVANGTTVDYGQNTVIESSLFESNSAEIGGGFFVTELGTLPSLTILNTEFRSNTGRQAAGAGALAESLDNLQLRVAGCTGVGNTASTCPDFLGFRDNSAVPLCISASNPFP